MSDKFVPISISKWKDGKLPEIKVDKRFVPKAPNLKHLRFSRKLPLRCNDCRYRSKEDGGNGICSVYKKDSLCRIRRDARKIIEKWGKDNPEQVLPLLKEEFEANYEKLKFFEVIENMSGQLDPEITKRINSMVSLSKLIHEFETKKTTVEMSERTGLSDEAKQEIARMIRVTHEESNP